MTGWFDSPPNTRMKPTGGWVVNPVIRAPGAGLWFERLEKVAQFNSEGTLSVALKINAKTSVGFKGDGVLDVPYSQIQPRPTPFAGNGLLTALHPWEIVSRDGNFYSVGGLESSLVNDGLTAIMFGAWPARFNGEGSFTCETAGGHKLEDGLTAEFWPKLPQNAGGVGTLTGAVYQLYSNAPALNGSGSLSATAVAVGPDITGVSPSSGAYDTLVTITGTGFVGVTSVTIGGQAVRTLTVVSGTQITCRPAGLANGTYNVVVTCGAQSDTAVNAFTYSFSAFTETSTARSNTAIPVGSQGVYVMLQGGGGSGGGGAVNNTAVTRYGGAGGGAGGRIYESFIPRSSLGATYSVIVGTYGDRVGIGQVAGQAGGLSRFSSGSIVWTANGGGPGAFGSTSTPSNTGTGGTVTTSGLTPSGGSNSGGNGSYWGGGGGGVGGGGGAGGWLTSANGTNAGDTGFAGSGGGAGGTSSVGNHGGSGGSAPDPATGVGGGGGGASSIAAATSCFGGGNGGEPGAAGGGAGACRSAPNNYGGYGGTGYTRLRWV